MVGEILIALALIAVGALFLLAGADWFMEGAEALAKTWGMSTLALGILLAGLEPEEMLTAAIASARGAPNLAVGNAIGTNITIVTLALGIAATLAPMTIAPTVRRQALIATLASLPPILLLFTGMISRLAGLLLLLLFVAYSLFLYRTDRAAFNQREQLEADEDDDDENQEQPGKARWRRGALPLLGLAAMALGGPAMVEGALRLAQSAGVEQGVVGATIIALGTGAEMIALAVSAARRRQSEVLVGALLGSFAYNLLVTLGLAALIRPLPVATHLMHVALPLMVIAHLLLLALVWRGSIGRIAGGLLIAAYLGFLIAVVLA